KTRLFPVGEYLPALFSSHYLASAFPRFGRLSGGELSGKLPFKNRIIAVNICYESMFEDLVRAQAREASLIVNLTDDTWFEGTPGAEWHEALSRLRAIEHRRTLLVVSNSGNSVVVSADGAVALR